MPNSLESFWPVMWSIRLVLPVGLATIERWSPEPWSGSTDSKSLDYQRTNPREYQIMRLLTREPPEYKAQHHPTTSSTLCRTPHTNTNKTKYKPNHQQTGLPPPSALPIRGKASKQTNRNSAQISSYKKLTQTAGPTLGGQKPKGRKNSTLKSGKRRTQTK